jgi:hypothetical protein
MAGTFSRPEHPCSGRFASGQFVTFKLARKKGELMNFEVNGISYFLTFDTNEAQWFLLTPSRDGVESVEIHNDGTLLTGPVLLSPSSGSARRMN